MFGFLANTFRSVLGLVTGSWQSAISAVVNWINQLETTHYKYWHTVSGHVAAAWQAMAGATLHLMLRMQAFMAEQGLLDYRIVRQYIPWLANWIRWLGGRVRNEIIAAIAMLRREYKAGDAAQHAYTRSVLLWVVVHVLLFLYRLVKTVFGWINGIGNKMWHYFTHLDQFAELLFMFLVAALERHAWSIGRLLGKFFLALIVRNVVRFASLVEEIVLAIL
jgi:hypothetical protein